MPKFAIATAAYPVNPAFIADFVSGVSVATQGFGDVQLIVAAESWFDAKAALKGLPANVILDLHPASVPTTPAGLRRLMTGAAAQSDAEIVVFADFDDRLLTGALDLHAAALTDADVSYGDMELIDETGHALGRRFFEDASVPVKFTGHALLASRNFIGFTNSAVRGSMLESEMPAIPDSVAAADWWFYTKLLAKGAHAQRTESEVTAYRVRRDSIVGHTVSSSPAVLRQRAGIALDHYAALAPEMPHARSGYESILKLIAAIDSDPQGAIDNLSTQAGKPCVWFEDVEWAAARLPAGPSPVARAI